MQGRLLKPSAIICDLDGTLCDISHRLHHFKAGNLELFEEALIDDPVNSAVFTVLWKLVSQGFEVIFVTARDESLRITTEGWLTHNCFEFHKPKVLMREPRDYRADAEVKRDIYEKHIRDWYDVFLVLEDRTSVVNMWRSLGLQCWQVAPGDY